MQTGNFIFIFFSLFIIIFIYDSKIIYCFTGLIISLYLPIDDWVSFADG